MFIYHCTISNIGCCTQQKCFIFKLTGVPVFLQSFKLRNAMKHFAMVLVALLIYSGQHAGQSAKILALLSVASPSHSIFNTALTVSLAERGHQVLYFAVFGSQEANNRKN